MRVTILILEYVISNNPYFTHPPEINAETPIWSGPVLSEWDVTPEFPHAS